MIKFMLAVTLVASVSTASAQTRPPAASTYTAPRGAAARPRTRIPAAAPVAASAKVLMKSTSTACW